MILPFAVVGIVKTVMPDMAYSARYYFQGNRQSHFQIYTVSHTGVGRKQITNNKFNSYAPMWIDRDHLAWVEVYQPLPMSKPGKEPKAKMRVMTYDMRTGTRKKVAEMPAHEFFYPPSALGNKFTVNDHGPSSTSIETTYKVTMKGITKVPNQEDVSTDEFGEEAPDSMDTLFGHRTASIEFKGQPWRLSWTASEFGGNEEESVVKSRVHLKSIWKRKTSLLELHGNYLRGGFVTSDGIPILLSSYKYEKYRQDCFLYKFSKDFQRCKLISSKVGSIQVNRNQSIWFGCQVGRKEAAMELLKDGRSVYVNWLYTGDYKTGKQWTVADGLVYVEECAFRPKAH